MGFRRAAVIMAGGSGTRFWPVSTEQRPKQFLRLASQTQSLLEQSVERIAPLVGDDLFVATAASMVGGTSKALPELPVERIFGEPERRNTLGALVWATANVTNALGGSQGASLAILTADHLIDPTSSFLSTVKRALDLAESTGSLVTIGIPATRAATEYGYVEKGEAVSEGAWRAKRFAEKPDAETAQKFVASGDYFWNSGMFFWTIDSFRSALKEAQPEAFRTMEAISESLRSGDEQAAARAFSKLPSISIDYALMEKAKDVCVVAAEFAWDDLGSWDALSRSLPRDDSENVSQGTARIIESRDCVVYNESKQTRVSVLGMDEVVIVVTDGEVMVCPKSRAQEVRKLAD